LVAGEFENSAVIESDWFWRTVVKGAIPPWDIEADLQNQAMLRAALSSAERMASAGYATVLEGIVGPSHLGLVRDELSDVEFPVSYVILRPTFSKCLSRARSRCSEPRHANALSDEGPLRHMYAKFAELGEYEGHVVDNSVLSAQETARQVVAGLFEPSFLLSQR
jgi:hypothetical protein